MDFAAVLEGLGIHKLITTSLFILKHLSSEDLKLFFNFNEAHLKTASDVPEGHIGICSTYHYSLKFISLVVF